jgi:signal peptidase I
MSSKTDLKLKKKSPPKQSAWVRETVGIFWTIAFIVFLRIYILEPYVIPSESMQPTLLVGDHVFVARGAYDFKVPLTNYSVVKVSDPHRGDVVVFDYPDQDSPDAGKFFVKRVMGIPGDTVIVKRGLPYVNGQAFEQIPVTAQEAKNEISGFEYDTSNNLYREKIPGSRQDFHWVQRMPGRLDHLDEVIELFRENYGRSCLEVGSGEYNPVLINELCEFKIPENQYFVMGDNRDNSSDGRVFGFVDRSLIKGRVLFVWFSPPPGEVNPYMSGPAIFAALKDMIPGLFRMLKDSGRLARVGMPIE